MIVAAPMALRRLDAGEYLYHAGDEPGYVYLLVTGRIRLEYPIADGHQADVLLLPGEHVGHLEAIAGLPWQASAAADVDGTAVTATPGDRYVAGLTGADFRLITRRFLATWQQATELLYRPSQDRIYLVLRRLASQSPVIDLTHESLARLAGVSREYVTRELQRMKAAGLIRAKRKRIIILRPERL